MHVAHTARLETFDIISHAARTGCNLLVPRSASNDDSLDRPLDEPPADRTSEAEKEEDVRLIDGTNERDDFMDKGELGEHGEPVSGDFGAGLAAASLCHKGTERRAKGGRFREKLGPFSDINEALADVVGEKDPDALKDPIVAVGNFERSSVNFDDCEDTDIWDKVRDRLCDGLKLGLFCQI
jgi:hypothetical protein